MLQINNGNDVFFTSDTHFSHQGIISFCGRPFESVEEMNAKLIENWNNTVPKNATVFHLGDFKWKGNLKDIIWQLNGNIHLIKGNHDEKDIREGAYKFFASVHEQVTLQIGNTKLYLNHYPFLTYAGVFKENNSPIQCFGHVHMSKYKNTGKDVDKFQFLLPTQYDVGVDLNNFTPISFQDLKKRVDFQIKNNVNCTYWIDNESDSII
jgi:calcineurin-like phosphoesterase family protein